MNKACPGCGGQFDCFASAACWCKKSFLPEKVLEALRIVFKDQGCLCQRCVATLKRVPASAKLEEIVDALKRGVLTDSTW